MADDVTTRELAKRLWDARLNGQLVAPEDVELPADEQAAYRVQSAQLQFAGRAIGFKIGATTRAAVDALDVSGPFLGRLFEPFRHDSGCELALPANHQCLIEVEVVVGLASDLPPRDRDYTIGEIAEAVAWISPGFELVATRFAVGLAGNGKLLIADGGVNHDFVCGSRCLSWREIDLAAQRAALEVNGEPVAEGLGGDSLFGHPLAAVAWLARHEQLVERGLKAGDIITTGSATGLTPVAAGDRARATFGNLGDVAATFLRT